MKLSSLKQLPVKAGAAALHFGDCKPRVEGREIHLSFEPEAEFHPLQGGSQFLLARGVEASPLSYLFGGTDEGHAFLVPVTAEAYTAFLEGGQGGFYRALMPKVIARALTHFGKPALRQGALIAVCAFHDWKSITHDSLFWPGNDAEPQRGDLNVFGTHHTLSGEWMHHKFIEEGEECILAKGLLKAEGHPSLCLNRIHIVARMRCIVDARLN